jgi:uncharacterized membrane protein YhiD involved in acid resistance
MDGLLGTNSSAPLSLNTLAVNLLIGIILAGILTLFYIRYGRSLSNRSRFAETLVPLALTTILIISVVKSSLALSLGLVGALSIVRFRTAIKEPEELVYLFIAIGIGLGLGADQRSATILAIFVILGFLLVRTILSPRPKKNNLFLNVVTDDEDDAFHKINAMLNEHTEAANLHRLDHTQNQLQATYLIQCQDEQKLAALMKSLRTTLPGTEVSFVEQNNTLMG